MIIQVSISVLIISIFIPISSAKNQIDIQATETINVLSTSEMEESTQNIFSLQDSDNYNYIKTKILTTESDDLIASSLQSHEHSADFLFRDYEEFYEPDIKQGPWVYHTDNLTICIKTSYIDNKLSYIADIYLRDNLKAYTGWGNMIPPGREREMPYIITRRYNAIFGLTGDFVSNAGNNKGVSIRDGKVYYNRDDIDVLAVMPTGELQVFLKGTIFADDLVALGVKDTFSFGPILVKDGKMTEAVTKHYLKPKNIRTGLGKIDDGHYIAILGQSKYTFTEYAELFISYGCEWAYNLDGGHSASMVIMGEQVNEHTPEDFDKLGTIAQRRISDVFLLGISDLVPDIDETPSYPGSN